MAKVLFVQPNYDTDNPHDGQVWMPLALVELATLLRENNHEVKIFDRNLYYNNKKFISTLKHFTPDIVGMTCYTSKVIKDIKQVSKLTKENSSAHVIIGGVHATLEPKSLLDLEFIDYVVRGEGEEPLLELCSLIDKNKFKEKNILKLKNLNYNEMRPFINLNTLPTPDYDLLEVKKYTLPTFATSRGCPGRCAFCYNLGRCLRFYNTDKVIETMENVLGKYKAKEFTIADDNFANLSQRTTRICKALEKYNAIFHIFLRVDQTQDKVMQQLQKAGCWSIQYGFESGSQRILDFIKKDATVKQNIDAIKKTKKYNIFIDGSFMLGLPTETVKEMKQTENFIKKSKIDSVDIKVYKPYPETELYEYAIKNKLMNRPKTLDDWEHYSSLKEGDPNVSNIPTNLLVSTVNKLSKSSYTTYLKKSLLLLKNKHYKYMLFKTKGILKKKLGIIDEL